MRKTLHLLPKDWQGDLMKGWKYFSAEYKTDTEQARLSQTPLLTKKNIKGQLGNANIDLYGPLELWKNVLWSYESKLSWQMDQRYAWVKKARANEQKNTISLVKHGALLWGGFAVAGSGNLDCMKDIMNSLKGQRL